MNPKVWKDAAYNIVTAIRKIDKARTLIVGASNFNSIYELSRMEPLADENIIYTVHFYEPFFFTHQGADWVGYQVATTGVPFPYAKTYPSINPKIIGTWSEQIIFSTEPMATSSGCMINYKLLKTGRGGTVFLYYAARRRI